MNEDARAYKDALENLNTPKSSVPADVLWGSFVTRNECVTNEPQRTSARRLTKEHIKKDSKRYFVEKF